MANNASTYHSHSVRIFSVSPSSILLLFRKHGSLEYSCQPQKSPFSISASSHTPHAKSATITSQVQFQIAKFKFCQYQITTFFCHFAKFNARQFSAIRYVAMVMPILYDNFYSPIDSNLKYESCWLYG